jgi:excinuclease UvrABC nuclease subunit
MSQPWLLPFENPLHVRFGREFFSAIPKSPGVYFFLGEEGNVLYVGKAKQLRARLQSYRRAAPGTVSRKVIRMLNLTRAIRWEELPSEVDALLRENKLLRELDPPFNVVNTRPDTYFFIGIRQVGGELRIRLTTSPKRQGDLLFGAYKGRGVVRRGHQALLRLLWTAQATPERFAFPSRLTQYRAPALYSVPCRPDLLPWVKRFLNGTDDALLGLLTERCLENEAIPRFVYHVIQEDLETAREFFEICPKRNRALRRAAGQRGRLIAQERLDDLIVISSVLSKTYTPLLTEYRGRSLAPIR